MLFQRRHAGLRDARRARLAVQFEGDLDVALLVRPAHALLADDEGLAPLDLDGDLLALAQAVEEGGRRQHRDVAVVAAVRGVVLEHLRIHEIRGEVGVAHLAADRRLGLGAPGLQVHRRQEVAGAARQRLLAAQHLLLQLGREAVGRITQFALHERDDRFGEGDLAVPVAHLLRRQVVGDHEQRHVAHHLGGRRHLDDVAEQEVHLGIGLRHLGQRCSRPMARACSRRLVYWPPGISWR
jgi:hypothetical protein